MARKKKTPSEMLPAIIDKSTGIGLAPNVTFLPVMEIPQRGQRQDYSLPKGDYSRKYVITLLKILLSQIHQMRFSPKDMQVTLQYSIQKLLTDIEMEDYRGCGVKHEPETKNRY